MVRLITTVLPEGRLLHTSENRKICASRRSLLLAMEEGRILEGHVLLCGADHSLIVRVGSFIGSIPRSETALGIKEGTTRDIASASDMLNISLLSKKVKKYYIASLREEQIKL